MAKPKADPDQAINAAKDEADSSAASATGSSSSDGGFISDAGPAFDAEAAAKLPPPEPVEDDEPIFEEGWDEEVVRGLLTLKGRLIHAGIGRAEDDWLYTEIDLEAIAPPLARIANRYPEIAALARHADPVLLVTAFGAYATRSLLERRQALAALEEEATEQPIGPGEGAPVDATPSVPAPPPPPRPTMSGTAQAANAAAPAVEAVPAERRPGEAQIDPKGTTWVVGD